MARPVDVGARLRGMWRWGRSAFVQSLFGDEGPAGNPRIGPRHARPDRQSATAVRIFPDYSAPIVRNQPEGRELMMARWGMPSPVFALQDKTSYLGVTNIRIGDAGSELRTAAWCPGRVFPRTRCCRTARDPRFGLPSTKPGRWPSLRHLDALDFRPESEGRRNNKRHFRVSDNRTEQGGRCDPFESNAHCSDGAGGDRRLDECASRGSAQAAKAAFRQFAQDCREGNKKDEGGLAA